MSNRSLFWFWHPSLSHNIEYKVTEAQDIDSATFALQVDILSHNAGTHLIVVGLAICVEVRLSIVVGDRSLCVESDGVFYLQGMTVALWCIVLTPRLN